MPNGTYGSGGTYAHIQVNGESILVTKDRQQFQGRKAVTELVANFIANNKGENGANAHQKGYKAEAVEGFDTYLKVMPLYNDKIITADAYSFLGLEGWQPNGSAGVQPANNAISKDIPNN